MPKRSSSDGLCRASTASHEGDASWPVDWRPIKEAGEGTCDSEGSGRPEGPAGWSLRSEMA